MILVDLNLLIYAVNADAPRHEQAARWWNETLSGDVPVGIPWIVILGFLRITTNPRVMPRPLAVEDATAIVDEWLEQPPVRCLEPTERHWPLMQGLLHDLGTAGNLTTDAHLAALALEHGAGLASTDNDFARFSDLRWRNPIT